MLLNYIISSMSLLHTGFTHRDRVLETRRWFLRVAESGKRFRRHGIEGAYGREALEHHRGSQRSLQGELDPPSSPRGPRVSGKPGPRTKTHLVRAGATVVTAITGTSRGQTPAWSTMDL